MKSEDIRTKFLEFFEKRGHKIIPSASLVPENDPTTLFTGSGMQPLVPYLLGEKHPAGTRLANSQKCFRSEDIEEVGDNRHTTFFEMLGNWSLGDYWKREQLSWFFEFLTKEIGIKKENLAVTCFDGDEKLGLSRDDESAEIWQELGIKKERIYFYGGKKNWWSRSGPPESMPVGEPGGSDSEVFYEFTGVAHDKKFGDICHPNCDCGRFMEIGNSVFMEYRKIDGGKFERLPRRNVDFGGGLERITAAINNDPDVFGIDVFELIIKDLEKASGKSYSNDDFKKSFRVIADHILAAVFLIADGVTPSNTEKGYFVRRLIRRAVRFGRELGLVDEHYKNIISVICEKYKDNYSLILTNKRIVEDEFLREVGKFEKTLEKGLKELEKIALQIWEKTNNFGDVADTAGLEISGRNLFFIYSSWGFPLEMSLEEIERMYLLHNVDKNTFPFARVKIEKEFKEEMKKHQELSRAGAEQKFKGGLADSSDKVVQYHTVTHLLHQALHDVLGENVTQKGSNITAERLRFDFTHSQKMAPEEIKKVEEIVNEKISANLPVQKVVLSKEEAEKTGARHFFGEKYGDQVSVYYIGYSMDTAYSKEFCGGPHVSNTSQIKGIFKIIKEEAVASGIRRIKAILE